MRYCGIGYGVSFKTQTNDPAFKEQKFVGDFTRCFGSDKVANKQHYKDGQFNGEVLEYYPNGNVKEQQTYNQGQVNRVNALSRRWYKEAV